MKTRLFIFSLLLASISMLMASCSPKNDVNTIDSKSQELYRIDVGGRYGFMDEYGNIIIEPQYDNANFFFCDSLCYAVMGERTGLINPNGEFIADINQEINWVYPFRNGTAICMTTYGRYGIIDKHGTFVLPAIYKKVRLDNSEETRYIVEDTLGKKGCVNNNGQFIIPCKYDKIYGFDEGLAVVAINNKYGYMDSIGHWVIDTIFDDARIFGNGLARVKKDGKWMFINHDGNTVESLCYDEIITGFSNKRAFVMLNDALLLIDNKGNTIKQIEVDSVMVYRDGFATFGQGGKYGKLDTRKHCHSSNL